MKTILLSLSLLACTLVCAQSNEPFIDPAISTAYESLVTRAEAHGKDYPVLLKEKGLVAIEVVDSLPNGDIGFFKRTGATFIIQIASVCLEDPTSLEWTLAHELGHGLDLPSVVKYLPDGKTEAWSTEIMAEQGVIDPTHIVYQIMASEQYSPGIWSNYFNQL